MFVNCEGVFDAKFLFSGCTYEVLCWVVILADAAFFTSAGFWCMLNNGGDGCCGFKMTFCKREY